MKTLLFTGLLTITSLVVRAQVYYLNLAAAQMPVLDCSVAVEQVLDGRAQQTAIGFVYRDTGNKPAAGPGARVDEVSASLAARP